VVGSHPGQARHRCPGAGCWVPQLAGVCWIGRYRIRTLSSSASAGHQHFAVRKQCGIVQFASSRHHRSSVLPSGIRTVQVYDLCGFRWISGASGRVKSAWTSTHEQYLSLIVHHCRTPFTNTVVATRDWAPITGASHIKVSGRLIRPGTEHLSVRRHKHKWIKRQR
jgi:hypothetical protein